MLRNNCAVAIRCCFVNAGYLAKHSKDFAELELKIMKENIGIACLPSYVALST